MMISDIEDVDKPLEPTQFFDNAYVPISREEEVKKKKNRNSLVHSNQYFT